MNGQKYKVFLNLINWSETEFSHLPWRNQRSLYRTLVSEIMLQQTTVGTVLNHYEKFLTQYPSIYQLAQSTEEEICISWKGLGYYRRARSLRKIAIQVVEEFKGIIPMKMEDLLQLKGIGPYTANAMVAIGADQRSLAVDANLERVLSRFYGMSFSKGPKLQKKLMEEFAAKEILAEMDMLSPRALNEAFMDLGRTFCRAQKANCHNCPLAIACLAKESGKPLDYPVVQASKKEKEHLQLKVVRIVVKDKNGIFLYQKKENEWLAGQWELPTFVIETNDKKFKQYPWLTGQSNRDYTGLPTIKTSITKYNIENVIVEMSEREFVKTFKESEIRFELKSFISEINISTSTIKVLKLLGNQNEWS